MHLHLPTLDVVSVFATLVAAGVSLLAWYRYRDAVALRSWAAALALGSVGALLFSLRGPGTSAALFVTADSLCVASYATMWVSMRRFNADKAPPLRMTIIAAAITSVFVLLVTISWQMGAALRAQSLVFSLFVGGLALATAWETWRGGRQDGLHSRRIAALALAGIAAARLIRVGLLGLDWFDVIELHTADVVWGYGMYFSTVCVLIVTFGLVLMANEQQARAGDDRPGRLGPASRQRRARRRPALSCTRFGDTISMEPMEFPEPDAVLLPPMLRAGDKVRFVSPASPPEREAVLQGAKTFESWGLEVDFGEHAFRTMAYLAGTDDERLADFNAALRDPGVRAIVATRGGKGSYRIAEAIVYFTYRVVELGWGCQPRNAAVADITNPTFTDENAAREALEAIRWPSGPVCPFCGCIDNSTRMQGKTTRPGLLKCNDCRKPYSVTIGTLYERSHIPLHKWLLATHLLASSKKGISAHQLHRLLGITYKSAWFMTHRIRESMGPVAGEPPMGGEGKTVEADETYIGRKRGMKKGHTYHHKQPVVSLVERNGRARSFKVDRATPHVIRRIVTENVAKASALMTDEAIAYNVMGKNFASHEAVNHSKDEYVRGTAHTNTVEGFYSIFKRGMKGVYQHCDEKHLQRYLNEFDFRYSNRTALGVSDKERAEKALKGIEGKRLTYRRTYGRTSPPSLG